MIILFFWISFLRLYLRTRERAHKKKNRKKQDPKDLLRALDYEDDESLYTKTEKFHNK